MLSKVPYTVVDAFTDRPFSGNPAAVVILSSNVDLTEAQKQSIALEMNLSETAFLTSTPEPHTFKLQWFTPQTEVAICGHATLASTSVLYAQGYPPDPTTGTYTFTTTWAGTLTGRVVESEACVGFELDFPEDRPVAIEEGGEREAVVKAVKACVEGEMFVVKEVSKGKYYAVAEIEMLGTNVLADLTIDSSAFAGLPYTGIALSTPLAPPLSYATRFFAPKVGIPEDPVTGSAHCMLAVLYTERFGVESGVELYGKQGGARRGEINVVWNKGEGRVLLRGSACAVAQGELTLTQPTPTFTPSTSSPERGTFIVLEGLDRTGKSTQVANLTKRFEAEGRKVRGQKFPDRTTPIGVMIDSYLKSATEMDDSAIHLLFSANRWECAVQIEKDLAAGISVIADRYAFSGIAFSAAKGLPSSWLLQPDKNLPAPDLTIFLTLTPEAAAARGAYGEERYETMAFQTRVRKEFEAVEREVKRMQGRSGMWKTVGAEGTVEEVEERVWGVVKEAIGRELGEVKRLWV